MQSQSKCLRLVTIILSLCCLLLPTANVWGQDEPTEDVATASASSDDVGEPVQAVEVPDAPGEAASPDREESAAVDEATLTHRAFLPMIQGGNQSGSAPEHAADTPEVQSANFTRVWVKNACINVLPAEGDFWDDMPGAGGAANNEAALIWLIANSASNETCTHSSATGNLANVNQMKIRVAVNDGALFTTDLYRLVGGGCVPWITFTTPAINDDSLFRTYTINFAAGSTICSVRVGLTDDPDSVAIRTSALLDYVELRNAGSGAILWNESF